MSRIIDCSCGHQVRAANDDGLFRACRQHIVEHYAGIERSDEQLREMIRARARDDVSAPR